MPTKKPQILIVLDEDLLKLVEDYRYGRRIPNRSQAIRELIREGLETYKTEPPPPPARAKKPRKQKK